MQSELDRKFDAVLAAITGPGGKLIIGRDDRTMAAAEALQAAGYDVRGIRPPTVPRNTARLRISITLNASAADIDGLAEALGQAGVG